jgi:hypothetical protein
LSAPVTPTVVRPRVHFPKIRPIKHKHKTFSNMSDPHSVSFLFHLAARSLLTDQFGMLQY